MNSTERKKLRIRKIIREKIRSKTNLYGKIFLQINRNILRRRRMNVI